MRTVFADAVYWIALLNPDDDLHPKAESTSKTLGACRIVTSEMVLTETLNGLSKYGPRIRQRAVLTVKALQENPNVEVVPQTSIQFRNATALYEKREDKNWGLTDCSSFDIMEDRGITDALTNDRHFQQARYRALLREGN